jgi:D-ribose pyranose/furanose isomerase RbsD
MGSTRSCWRARRPSRSATGLPARRAAQIDLPAEREMTAVLQLLQDIARHLEVQTTVTAEQLQDLMKTTDLRRLTDRMRLAEPVDAAALSTAPSVRSLRVRQRHE